MYRYNALFFILILLGFSSWGQNYKYAVGIELGPSRTFLSGNSFLEEYHDPTLGFSGGLSFQGNITNHLSWRTGFGFERKGSQGSIDAIDLNGAIEDLKFYVQYDYFTIPLLLRYTFGNRIKFYANAGMYYALLNRSAIVDEDFHEFPNVSNSEELNNPTDYGFTLGIGSMTPLGKNLALSLEIRHNKGLTNVSSVEVMDDGEINMNSTNLLLGIAYNFGSNHTIILD